MAENELKMAPIFNHFTFLERLKFKHPIIAATITISDKGERSSDESAIFTTKIFQKNCQKLFFPYPVQNKLASSMPKAPKK